MSNNRKQKKNQNKFEFLKKKTFHQNCQLNNNPIILQEENFQFAKR